jgi:hypothetical protein
VAFVPKLLPLVITQQGEAMRDVEQMAGRVGPVTHDGERHCQTAGPATLQEHVAPEERLEGDRSNLRFGDIRMADLEA